MSEWQPIETAPKDGRWFLVATPSKIVAHARCSYVNGKFVVNTFSMVDVHGADGFDVTHWMPLPEPPK